MLLVQCSHFISLFVCLELVTVAFYVLVAFQRTKVLSLEAGLKYLTLGGLSSAILLFGIVLLYGISGNPEMIGFINDGFQFQSLQSFIDLNSDNLIVRLGALFVLAGICFKIGLVPFQIWVPDVYQGAPTPTTSFLAVASKAAGVFLLIQLLQGPFFALDGFLIPILSVLCVLTILFGNISATGQTNIKRLIGLSGISHAGYLLLGVIASYTVPGAIYAVLFYLSLYLLGSFLLFAPLSYMENEDDSLLETKDYRGLYKRNPLLGVASLIGIASLAGVPPLGGFIAKVLLFIVAYQAGLYGLLAVAIVGVVISIYYYFGWIRSIVFISDDGNMDSTHSIPLSTSQRCLLIILIGLISLAGLFPSLLNYFVQ
jgi:NADH-quinone oxidoreductase subunit N